MKVLITDEQSLFRDGLSLRLKQINQDINILQSSSLLEMQQTLSSEPDTDILILDIDIQGALYIKEKGIDANYIFITPPSIDELKKRLEERGTETEESIKLRIWNAKRELEYKDQFDIVIENNDIEEAYTKLEEAINSKL